MKKYRVLALDGGGIRGLLTATLLKNLCRQPAVEGVFESIDLIAGTSSGGLIALAMAHGLNQPTMSATLEKLCDLFEDGRQTFGRGLPWYLGGTLFFAKYATAARRDLFRRMLGEATLGDLRRRVLVASFELDNEGKQDGKAGPVPRRWKPKIFHNFDGVNTDRARPAWEVALATTAAPAYFRPFEQYIDGGVYSNNPSMCALAQMFDARYNPPADLALGDIALLSIGAGQNLSYLTERSPNWGAFRWGVKYVDLTMDGTVGIADYQCEQLLTHRYFRLQHAFDAGERISLDDFGRIPRLKAIAEGIDIRPCTEWLKTQWLPHFP